MNTLAGSVMGVGMKVALAAVALGAILVLVRLVRGPTLVDRVMAADLLVLCVVVGLGVYTAGTGDTTYLDVLVVLALLGFVSTAVSARFVEQRGA